MYTSHKILHHILFWSYTVSIMIYVITIQVMVNHKNSELYCDYTLVVAVDVVNEAKGSARIVSSNTT